MLLETQHLRSRTSSKLFKRSKKRSPSPGKRDRSRDLPLTSCIFSASLTVSDWPAVESLVSDFPNDAAGKFGVDYFFWSRDDESQLNLRGACVDSESLVALLGRIGKVVTSLVEGPAALDSGVEIHGPASEIGKLKASIGAIFAQPVAALGVMLFEVEPGGVAKLARDSAASATLCTSCATFTVLDWESIQPLMAVLVNRSAAEAGCVHFGWSKSGSKLFSHEAFNDGAALAAHLANAKACLEMMGEFATLDAAEVHGPTEELEKAVDTVGGDLEAAIFVTLASSPF